MFVHFALEFSRIGKVLNWQEFDFDVRISRAMSIHRFQITGIKYINFKSIFNKDGPNWYRSKSDILAGFKRLFQSIQLVKTDQISGVRSMQFEQPADLCQSFILFVNVGIRIVLEEDVDDIQQFFPFAEPDRFSLFLFNNRSNASTKEFAEASI